MYAQLRYLDGPAEGRLRVASRDFVTIGRHPDSDVPFDPVRDLQVSVRHAAIFKQGGGFMVRDLGSSNGTYLNGKRVRGDLPLEPADVLQLGPTGPRLEFAIAETLPRLGDAERIDLAPEPPRFRRSRARATERLAILRPPRRSKHWRWLLVAVLIAIGVVATRLTQTRQQTAMLERERAMLLARLDDLAIRLEQTRSGVAGLATALRSAQREAAALRTVLAAGPARELALDSLGQVVQAIATRDGALVRAAAVDPSAWLAPVLPALVAVASESQAGTVRSGTAVAVASQGDSVWLVTARRLAVDSVGMPPLRLALVRYGTTEVLLGRVARVADSGEVGLIAVRVRGGAPPPTLGDGPSVGDPVVVAGISTELDAGAAWRVAGLRAAAIVATVIEVGPDQLALDLYGQAAPPGALIVGAAGEVLGLLTGADRATGVPATAIRALLAPMAPGSAGRANQ